jgi:hypothetical protein
MFALNDPVKVIDRRVTFSFEEVLEDDDALAGMLEMVICEIAFENLELLSLITLLMASHFGVSPSPYISQNIDLFRHRFFQGKLGFFTLENESRPSLMEPHLHPG